jgi:UDP-2-acetamido-3-amino-2,3-dideoxy-glucuronate N-acetyltransferase
VGDGVFIAAHMTFTNDFYLRACVNDLSERRPWQVDEHTTFTTVQDGVTIGAAATVGSDLVIGRFAVIGMSSVVTRTVPAYTLVLGAPAHRGPREAPGCATCNGHG